MGVDCRNTYTYLPLSETLVCMLAWFIFRTWPLCVCAFEKMCMWTDRSEREKWIHFHLFCNWERWDGAEWCKANTFGWRARCFGCNAGRVQSRLANNCVCDMARNAYSRYLELLMQRNWLQGRWKGQEGSWQSDIHMGNKLGMVKTRLSIALIT